VPPHRYAAEVQGCLLIVTLPPCLLTGCWLHGLLQERATGASGAVLRGPIPAPVTRCQRPACMLGRAAGFIGPGWALGGCRGCPSARI